MVLSNDLHQFHCLELMEEVAPDVHLDYMDQLFKVCASVVSSWRIDTN